MAELLAPSDYLVIAIMILISTGIGLFYGVSKKKKTMLDNKQSAPEEYFLADRKMTLIPLAFSSFATGMASSTILGNPTESYNFGMIVLWWCFSSFMVGQVINFIFIPLYHEMGSINVFKFLEIRYNKPTKNIVTVLTSLKTMMIGSNIVYGTSTALNRVTDINTWIIILIVTSACVLYTSIGGIKGVMLTDVFQGVVMLVAFVAAILLGFMYVGGIGPVWQHTYESGRLEIFDFNLDPTVRHTFWTGTFGYFVVTLSMLGTSQSFQQRFLTAPNVDSARRANTLGFAITATVLFLSQLIGCILYTEYHACDPIKSKAIKNPNQLVPALIMKVTGAYPFLPGLFFAGLLAASLSTLSSIFNSVPAAVFESLVQPLRPNMSSKESNIVCKLLSVLMGMMTVACILLTRNFPNVKQALVSLSATLDPSVLILILFGLLLPQANFKAAILAFLSGIAVSLWTVAGGLIVRPPMQTKPLFTDGCSAQNVTISSDVTWTVVDSTVSPWAVYFPLYSVSYLWISVIGVVVSSTVFIVMSHLFGKDRKRDVVIAVTPKTLRNFHRSLSKPMRKFFLCDVYDNDVDVKMDASLNAFI